MWSSRGWNFQEGTLSRRRLVFTEAQLYFQCNDKYRLEGLPYQFHSRRKAKHPPKRHQLRARKHPACTTATRTARPPRRRRRRRRRAGASGVFNKGRIAPPALSKCSVLSKPYEPASTKFPPPTATSLSSFPSARSVTPTAPLSTSSRTRLMPVRTTS
jgi:hypothetical protein